MPSTLIKCKDCRMDKYPNQLNAQGICQGCQSRKRNHGEMQSELRSKARATALKDFTFSGMGWVK